MGTWAPVGAVAAAGVKGRVVFSLASADPAKILELVLPFLGAGLEAVAQDLVS
jgi:hypothetical protein